MIRHVSGIAEIVDDVAAAVGFYRHTLGLTVEYAEGEPYGVVTMPGVLHFGLWDRRFAAMRLYGDSARAHDVPAGFILGLEVDDPETAVETIRGRAVVLQETQEEPWGQTTARFLTPGGGLCEFTKTPWARSLDTGPVAATSDDID